MTVKITTGKNNLHSGLAGGVAPSASHELARLIASWHDKKGKISIPGFYESVQKPTKEQLAHTTRKGTTEALMKLLGIKGTVVEPGMNPFAQIGLRPTLQVSGIKSGYTGEGYSNIVPATAEARINVRVVGGQDPKAVYESMIRQIKAFVPAYATVEITRTEVNEAIALDISKSHFKKARELLKKAYGKDPLITYVGGSIPIVADFKHTLGIDTLLVSLGNDDCNMHGVDENFRIDLIEKGLKFSRMLFGN